MDRSKMPVTPFNGLAFVAEFGKRQPGLLLIKNTKDDNKNYSPTKFGQPGLKPIGR